MQVEAKRLKKGVKSQNSQNKNNNKNNNSKSNNIYSQGFDQASSSTYQKQNYINTTEKIIIMIRTLSSYIKALIRN